MTEIEAKASLIRWRRWAAGVRSRWEPDSPMARLAKRRELEAELRLLECQDTMERERSQGEHGIPETAGAVEDMP